MRRVWAASLIMGVVIAAAAGAWFLGRRSVNSQQAATPEPPPPSVLAVPVENRVLERVVVSRAAVSLETFASISLAAMEVQGAGVVTRAAEAGSEVREGDPVLEVDARPVFLLRGERPAYRAVAAGDFGPDVSQLQQSLNRLGIGGTSNTGVFDEATGRGVLALYLRSGYLPATGEDWPPETLTRLRNLAVAVADSDDPSCRPPDTRLSCPLVTEAARLYQAQTGLRIPFGEIAFAPQGPPLAVGGVPPPRGGSVYEAELDLASAEPVVLVALSPFDAGRVSVGSRAVLDDDPEGRTASGAVTDLWAPEDVPEYGGTSTLARVVLEEGGTELLGRSMRVRIIGESTGRAVTAVPTAAVRSDASGRLWIDLLEADGAGESRIPVEVTTGVEAGGLVEVEPVAGIIPPGAWAVVGGRGAQ